MKLKFIKDFLCANGGSLKGVLFSAGLICESGKDIDLQYAMIAINNGYAIKIEEEKPIIEHVKKVEYETKVIVPAENKKKAVKKKVVRKRKK